MTTGWHVEVMFFWAGFVVLLLACGAVDWRCRLSVYPFSTSFSRSFPPVALFVIFVILTPAVGNTAVCHTCNQFFAAFNFFFVSFRSHLTPGNFTHRGESFSSGFPPALYPTLPFAGENPSLRTGCPLKWKDFLREGGGFPTDATHFFFFLFFLIFLRKNFQSLHVRCAYSWLNFYPLSLCNIISMIFCCTPSAPR